MDLIALPFEGTLPAGVDSRYRIVTVSSQRARQLSEGAKPSVTTRYTKPTTIALQEFFDGKLEFLTGKEARVAQKEAKRIREEAMAAKALEARHAALSEEIKRDLSVYVEEGRAKEALPHEEEPAGGSER
ncbi:MAG TPA: DNA-directed RNA polymerase subunit omega [Nitrospiria bacterium]|nr:DNA-directed RNA polymerase subunit omega [Nitrospiria bacterium]